MSIALPSSGPSSEMASPLSPQTSSNINRGHSRVSKWWISLLTLRGPLLMLLAEAFGGCMAATTRLLEMPHADGSPGMHTLQILFARFSITAVLSLLYMWWRKVENAPLGPPEIRKWLVLRGCAGFCGVFGFYCEFSTMHGGLYWTYRLI
jgi:drug/metabolite transporter (DMT)-like permease